MPIVLALALAAAVLAGAGITGWKLAHDDETTNARDSRPDRPAEGSDAEADPSASASVEAGASAPPMSESSGPSAGVTVPAGARCWDGSSAASVDGCPYPSGRAGLEWVFPSMGSQACSDVKASLGSSRVELWECLGTLADGTSVRLNYSQWRSISQGHDHFSGFLGAPAEVTNKFGELALYRWNGVVEGEYERAVLDAREPFSVAVFVADPNLRDAAFEQLVRLRPGSQFRGVPAS